MSVLQIVGRINLASESLFYYDVNDGFDFNYYRNTTSYNLTFDYQPTAQQEQEAKDLCTQDDGTLNSFCVYDYYGTGNNVTAAMSAYISSLYTAVQKSLGLFLYRRSSFLQSSLFASLAFVFRPRYYVYHLLISSSTSKC